MSYTHYIYGLCKEQPAILQHTDMNLIHKCTWSLYNQINCLKKWNELLRGWFMRVHQRTSSVSDSKVLPYTFLMKNQKDRFSSNMLTNTT